MTKSRKFTGPVVGELKGKHTPGEYWYLTCACCPWSARVSDKVGADNTAASHARTCWRYRNRK